MRAIAVVIALVVLAAVMAKLAGIGGPKIDPDAALAPAPAPQGQVVEVAVTPEPRIEQAVGTVRAREEALVSSRITATVVVVHARAGDSVEVDDVLVELDDRDLRARLAQMREAVTAAAARLTEARSSHDRNRQLYQKRTISRAALDSAEASLSAATAELTRAKRAVDEAEAATSFSVVRAPFAGRIVERYVDTGDVATPGAALMRIYDPARMRIEANVRESLAIGLERGSALHARIDALDRTLAVTVDEVVPAADPGSRTFLVKASMPVTAGTFPGMFGRLQIPLGTVERLYVPVDAVRRVGQLELVTAMTDAGARSRFVRTGRRSGDRIEVLSGLAGGESVLVPDAR